MLVPNIRIQEPYLVVSYINPSEHLNIYNKAIVGLPERDRYKLIRSKWNEFYQELEDDVSTFGSKAAVLIVTTRYVVHVPTEFKNVILFYPSITQAMMESHCEIMWDNISGAGLGCHPTADYGAAPDAPEKQAIIAQQRLRSKILGLWINNLLTTDAKHKLRAFRNAHTFNNQDYGDEMFFVVVKMVLPDTQTGFSDIKTKMETMKTSQLKHDIPRSNLQIAEWMNYISIYVETYSEIARQKFSFLSTS